MIVEFLIVWYDAICCIQTGIPCIFDHLWNVEKILYPIVDSHGIWCCFNPLWSQRDAFCPKMSSNLELIEESILCIWNSCMVYSRALHLLRISELDAEFVGSVLKPKEQFYVFSFYQKLSISKRARMGEGLMLAQHRLGYVRLLTATCKPSTIITRLATMTSGSVTWAHR